MMKPMLGFSLHFSMPACVQAGGVWAPAGGANIAISANATKVRGAST
jgi:hypothetical protein